MPSGPPISIAAVLQSGRLAYEALLLAASLAQNPPTRPYRLFLLEPQPGPLWPAPPQLPQGALRDALCALGATILPFASQHFGAAYPQGNKIEGLAALPADTPFVFLDTDTLILSDLAEVQFDFDRPTASLRRENTWPTQHLYGPDHEQIWRSLYQCAQLDFESSLDLTRPRADWRRYLYFNAGFFFYRCPKIFGEAYLKYARMIRDTPPAELALQKLDPWLDQIALPLTVHALGGGRDSLPKGQIDGSVTCHYRSIPLLYARENDRAVAVLEHLGKQPELRPLLMQHAPFRRCVLDGRGRQIREIFTSERAHPKPRESMFRRRLKREGMWMR